MVIISETGEGKSEVYKSQKSFVMLPAKIWVQNPKANIRIKKQENKKEK